MSTVEILAARPRRILDRADVPDVFSHAFDGLGVAGARFPLVLHSPSFRFSRHLAPANLLVHWDDVVACITWRDGAAMTRRLNLGDVHQAERGTERQHGWIGFHAHGPTGRSSVRADFNSVGLELYLPVLEAFRRRLYPRAPGPAEHQSGPFQDLEAVNHRLMDLAQHGLTSGAEVRYALQQNAVRFRALGLFDRILVPGSMAIATQQELILIREGEAGAEGDQPYAGVWTYLPLSRIARITAFPLEGGERLLMDITLQRGESIRSEYELGKHREVSALVECVRRSHPSVQG